LANQYANKITRLESAHRTLFLRADNSIQLIIHYGKSGSQNYEMAAVNSELHMNQFYSASKDGMTVPISETMFSGMQNLIHL